MKRKNKMHPLITLFVGGIMLTVGDIIAAQWVRFGGNHLYLFVFSFYLLGMMLLIETYKTENIPTASIILVIFNVIILILAGKFLFDEDINFLKIIGIILCFVSIFLLQFGKRKIPN